MGTPDSSTALMPMERLLSEIFQIPVQATPARLSPRDAKARQTHFESRMEKVLRMLSTRERAVTELAFGIGHDEPRTDEDIASMLQIKKRRVQAAKTDAMNKLRQPTVKKWLVELVGKPTAK